VLAQDAIGIEGVDSKLMEFLRNLPNEPESKQLTFNLLMQSERVELTSPQDDFRTFEYGAREIEPGMLVDATSSFVEAAVHKTPS